MSTFGTRPFIGLAGLFCLTLSIFTAGTVAADDIDPDLPVLIWQHGDLTNSDSIYTLSWSPAPEHGGYDFVRIEVYDPADGEETWWPRFVTESSHTFASYVQGERLYRLRACALTEDGGESCGAFSDTISATSSAAVETARAVQLKSDLPEPAPGQVNSVPGGAAGIYPGLYVVENKKRMGWSLNWVNDLRCKPNNPDHCFPDNVNELWVQWATYRDFSGNTPGERNMQPVWLIGALRADVNDPTGKNFIGNLYYFSVNPSTGVKTRTDIGNIEIERGDDNLKHTVRWHVTNDSTFYSGSPREVEEELTHNSDYSGIGVSPDPSDIDHFQGWWLAPTGTPWRQQFTWTSYITGDFEFGVLAFFDNQGEPIWGVAQYGGYEHPSGPLPLRAHNTNYCVFTVIDGWYPDVNTPDNHPFNNVPLQNETGPCALHPGDGQPNRGWNLMRKYGPLEADDPGTHGQPGEMVLRVHIPDEIRTEDASRTLYYGSLSYPGVMHKWVNNHVVRYFVDEQMNPGTCEMQGASCEYTLDWFSDGYYPDATLYLFEKTGDDWDYSDMVPPQPGWPVANQFSVQGYSYEIDESGWYRFELRRDDSDSQLIAFTRTFHVTGNAVPGQLAITPDSIDYGYVVPGERAFHTFVLENTGSAGSSVEISDYSASGAAYSVVSQGTTCSGAVLASGDSCTVRVRFQPSSTSDYNGTLNVTSTANNIAASLSGRGVASCGAGVTGTGTLLEATPGEQPTLEFADQVLADTPGVFELAWIDKQAGTEQPDIYALTRVSLDTADEQPTVHYLPEPQVRVAHYVPGTWRYTVQACQFDGAQRRCGAPSEPLILDVSSGPERGRQPVLRSELPEPEEGLQSDPPAVLGVGAYQSGLTDYNGWNFSWTTELRFADGSQPPNDVWELFAIWATYQDLSYNSDSSEENLQPVWLTAHLSPASTDGNVFDGSLYYWEIDDQGNQIYTLEGDVRLCLDGPAGKPRVEWNLPDGSFYQSGNTRTVIDDLTSVAEQQGVSPNPNEIDHHQGSWKSSELEGLDRASVFSYIVDDLEMNLLTFYDHQGKPIWGTSIWGGFEIGAGGTQATQDPENFCVYGVLNGWYPDVPFPDDRSADTVPYAFNNSCDESGTYGWNLRREFDDLAPGPAQQGGLSLQVWVPPAFRGQQRWLVAGSENDLPPMEKQTNFHDIRYVAGSQLNPETCVMATGACELSLIWYSGGDYPEATLYLRREGGDVVNEQGIGWGASGDRRVIDHPYSINQPGSYRFELYRTSDSDGQRLAITRWFDVLEDDGSGGDSDVEDPLPPLPDPGFTPDPVSSRVGATAGEFRVDESGAANYSIPIMTVPGSGGVAPEVSLTYNSNSGRGPLGDGWSVSGFSTISRCGQTIEQDGATTGVSISADDRFCLDGQKLMLVSGSYGVNGSEYRLEIDDFTRVTAHGGLNGSPTHFTVRRKDGSTSIYGSSSASNSARIEATVLDSGNWINRVFAWPIREFKDSAENYITFDYFHPPGDGVEWLPEAIHYTGNWNAGTAPFASIEFVYQNLPTSQRTAGYAAGQKTQATQHLWYIDSRVVHDNADRLVRRYWLDYGQDSFGRNLLEGVQECWSEDPGDCLNETEFDWQSGVMSLGDPEHQWDPDEIPNVEAFHSAQAGDLTGNGRQEVVYRFDKNNDDWPDFNVVLNPDSTATTFDLSADPDLAVTASCKLTNNDKDIGGWALVDLEGNGYLGLVYAIPCENQYASEAGIYYYRWDHEHGKLTFEHKFEFPANYTPFKPRITAADYDGDGLSDLILSDDNRGSTWNRVDVAVYRNLSQEEGELTLSDPLPVMGLPQLFGDNDPPPPPIINCIHYEFKLFEAPLADVDTSGRVALLGTATRTEDEDCLQDGSISPPEEISSRELEESRAGRADQGGTPGDWDITAVFQLNDEGGEVRISKWASTQFMPNDIVIPTDVNADGLTDFVTLSGFNASDRCKNASNQYVVDIHHNQGGGQSLYPTKVFCVDEELAPFAKVLDYTGNGYPDFLIPNTYSGSGSNPAHWRIHRWKTDDNGGTFESSSSSGPIAGKLNHGDTRPRDLTVFADLFGNGRNDIVAFFRRDGWNGDCGDPGGGTKYCIFAAEGRQTGTINRYSPINRITRITDGLGAWTGITYKSLAQRSVYTRDNNGPYDDHGNGAVVYDTVLPIYVVSAAESLAPQVVNGNFNSGATSRIEYYYTGAKLQGGGRGMLGFREVASYDEQSAMLTRTVYRQDFPYIGLPLATQSWYQIEDPWPRVDDLPDVENCPLGGSPDPGDPVLPGPISPPDPEPMGVQEYCYNNAINPGIELGRALNTWDEISTSTNTRYSFLAESVERSYVPSYKNGVLTGSDFTHRVVTLTGNLDAYGNPRLVDVATYTSQSGTSSLVSQQTTVNEYTNNASNWHLGRLTCAEVTSERPGWPTQVRRTRFGYHPTTGILNKEVIEPDTCTSDAGHRLKTDHALDNFGNRRQTTVSGPDIDTDRLSRVTYDPSGRFVEQREVYVSGWKGTEWVFERDRYGNPTQVRNGQGITKYHYYDYMGRPHYTYTPDGAWGRTRYFSSTSGCPAGTAFREVSHSAGGGASEVCRDVLGREVRTRTLGFDGAWINADIRYDYASRPVWVSEPAFGTPVYWTYTDYDEVGRVLQITHTDGSEESWIYDGLTTTHVNTLNQDHTVVRNPLGEKTQETAADDGVTVYSYDALGQLRETDGPLPGTQDLITIDYDEMGHKKKMIDPDKGTWHYRYNAAGELICQRDAKNQGTYFEYDTLGRVKNRYDRSGVTSLSTCAGTQKGRAIWDYHNSSPDPRFGQVTFEFTTSEADTAGPSVTTSRTHDYDGLGRLKETSTQISESGGLIRSYTERTTYDQLGRVFQQFDASGDNRGMRYVYNTYGYLEQLKEAREGTAGRVYWEVQTQDARGNVTQAELGNGIVARAQYDPATGRVTNLWTENDIDTMAAQNLELIWDVLGNLEYRHDRSLDPINPAAMRSEHFFYDGRNRLKRTERRTGGGGAWSVLQELSYDPSGAGNITWKSDVGSYSYDDAGPHAVTSVGGQTWYYDANGNVEADGSRFFEYTTFSKLRRVSRSTGALRTTFDYGPGREKVLKRELQGSTVLSRTHYVGNVEVVWDGANPGLNTGEYRRYIGGVALVTFDESTGITRVRYQHKDHLGSVTAITDQNRNIVAQMGFDAWGQRRKPDNPSAPWEQWTQPQPVWADAMLELTPRGYTGHEQLDDHGIVHMGGRIYDPHLARFLQADPLVEDSTTLNRYSYVLNNPLAYNDPSGYSFKNAVGKFARYEPGLRALHETNKFVANNQYLDTAASAAACYWGGPWGCAAASAVGTHYRGGDVGEALKAGFISGATAAAFGEVGGAYQGGSITLGEYALYSGVIGGVSAELQGGSFGHGFAAAGLTAAASPAIDSMPGGAPVRITTAAVVGGTASSITGGKFANGALSGAMVRAFGELASRSNGNDRVSGGIPDKISVEEARLLYDKVIEALNMIGRDTSGFGFDERYGVRVNGELVPTSDYDEFLRLATGPGREPILGNHNGGRVTIFRNAFSTDIYSFRLRPGDPLRVGPFAAGFQSGLFVAGHELAHFHGQRNESAADRQGWRLYQRVCGSGLSERHPQC